MKLMKTDEKEAAYEMLRMIRLVVRATKEKNLLPQKRGEITNYNEIYIQQVTKERN